MLHDSHPTSCQCCPPHHSKKRGLWQKKHSVFWLAVFLLVVYFFPWRNINWGVLELGSASTITVTGKADGSQRNQIASFYVSVAAENQDKETATNEVNANMAEVIAQLKEFGLPEEDIQTENIHIYQTRAEKDEPFAMIEVMEVSSSRPAPPTDLDEDMVWRAENSISLTLREIDRASELASLLTESKATNVSGPNLRIDDSTALEEDLLQQALAAARKKAESMVANSGQEVGKIVRISEGFGGIEPRYYADSFALTETAGVATPVEVGSQEITKTVTVVFELR